MAIVKPPPAPIPPPPGKPGGLGEKLETTLRRVFARLLNDAQDTLAGIVRFALETFLEALEPVLIKYTKPLLAEIRDQPGIPDSFKHLVDNVLSGQDQAATVLLSTLGTQAAGSVMGSVLNSLLAPVTYAVNRKIHPWRLDPSTVVKLLQILPEDRANVVGDAYDAGLDDLRLEQLYQATLSRLGPADWITYYYRTGRNKTALVEHLKRSGFDGMQIEYLLKIAENMPGLSDIVRMAVREAWNDSVASRFGYDEGRPAKFAEYLDKLGYDADWATRYWRAHWDLPSPSLGFEMFQRKIITQDELKDLLTALDIPPFWRERLIKAAYTPITRVDVRRMWQTGHIKTVNDLIRRYEDVGYSPEDAAALAAWTVEEYSATEKKATRTEILKAYKMSRLSRAQAQQALEEIGIQSFYADLYLDEIDLEKANEILAEKLSLLKAQYISGIISQQQLIVELNKLNLPASETQAYVELWSITRESKIKRPTKSELRAMFLENVIDEATFRRELSGTGLSALYVDWYVLMAKRDKEQAAIEEVEKRRAEEEKLRLAKIKERYELDVARLNLESAQLKLAIAELELSVTDETTPEEMTEIMTAIQEMKKRLLSINIDKATARVQQLNEQAGGR